MTTERQASTLERTSQCRTHRKGVVDMAKSKTRRYLVTLGLTSALVLGGMTTLAPAAQADNSRCPAKRICLFQHDDFGGWREVFRSSDRDLRNDYAGGSPVNNEASSMINNTGRRIALWEDHGCGGQVYVARKESEDTDLHDNGAGDQITCVDFI
jgi:hypothetical protein